MDVCRHMQIALELRCFEAAVAAVRGSDLGDPVWARSAAPKDVADMLMRQGPDLVRWRALRVWIEALERAGDPPELGGPGSSTPTQRVCRRVRELEHPAASRYMLELMDVRRPVFQPGRMPRPDVAAALKNVTEWRAMGVPEDLILGAVARLTARDPDPNPSSGDPCDSYRMTKAFACTLGSKADNTQAPPRIPLTHRREAVFLAGGRPPFGKQLVADMACIAVPSRLMSAPGIPALRSLPLLSARTGKPQPSDGWRT